MGFKTVRNGNEKWCRDHGVSGEWRTCATPRRSLRKKVFEELGEFLEHFEAGELYDLRDVLAELARVSGPAGKLCALLAAGVAGTVIRAFDPGAAVRRSH